MRRDVIGREGELATIRQFVDTRPTRPGILVIEGEPGIGKTTLWLEALRQGREDGWRTLTAQPTEPESALSFSALGDLFDPVYDTVARVLPTPQRRALDVALLRADATNGSPDLRAVAVATLSVLRTLCTSGPVLLAVDDAQWLDKPSARALEFALRRLDREAVRTVLAARAGHDDHLGARMASASADREFVAVTVGPLGVDALDELFRSRLGTSFLRPMLRQLHATAAGNPFYALELARALLETDAPIVPYAPFPVPRTLGGLIDERLQNLPPRVRQLLLAVASLSRPTVASLRTATDADDFDRILATGISSGAIELDDERVRFTHPLLASAVYAAASGTSRRELHSRLAAQISDPEERARHLALAAEGPDAGVAASLDTAARIAYARAAPEAAAALAEQALRLTPADARADLERRGLAVGDYQLKAGDTIRAREVLEQTVATAVPGVMRARALHRLAFVRVREDGWPAGASTLRQALAEVDDDARLKATILGDLSLYLTQTSQQAAAEEPARSAVALAEQLDDARALGRALTILAWTEFLLGRGFRSDILARTAEAIDERERDPSFEDPAWFPPGIDWALMLKWSDRFNEARSRLERIYRNALEWHDEALLPSILFQLGELECWLGNRDIAERYAREARDAGQQHGEPVLAPLWLYLDALLAAHAGRVEEARSIARQGVAISERTGNHRHLVRCIALLGFVDLSLGRPAAARTSLLRATELAEAASYGEPGVLRFDGDTIEVLIALGELDDAERLLERLEERGTRLDRVWALATAARCRGILFAARGDQPAGLAAFETALAHHERLDQPFELGRTLLALGAIQRRAKQRRHAREALDRALAIFERLEMPLWVERVGGELSRVSGRAPARHGLTAAERQVAELAAEGRTNKEIAEIAFMSVKTVEGHLSRTYSKLGVRSRTELARTLSPRLT